MQSNWDYRITTRLDQVALCVARREAGAGLVSIWVCSGAFDFYQSKSRIILLLYLLIDYIYI
jgi:hypothetical protein